MKYSLEKRKDGLTSCYAMHCGYIDLLEVNGFRLRRWHEGGTVYHVSLYNKFNRRVFWEVFEKSEDSARFFKSARKAVKKGMYPYGYDNVSRV